MKHLPRFLSAAVLGLAVLSSTLPASAQEAEGGRRRNREGGAGPGGGQGNWDPAQMRQRMMERMREQFAVTDDAEWKLISERIEKVTTARTALNARGGFGFGGGRGGGPGGPGGPGGQGGGPGGGRGGMFGEVSPEQDALQKAVESNAPAEEIKTKLAKFRASQKDKEAKLAKAQEDLRQVLSAKQEATAVLLGLVK